MKGPEVLNPFAVLRSGSKLFERVISNRKRSKEAQKTLAELLAEYGEITRDPRYTKVCEQIRRVAGENLSRLIDEASKCPNCAEHAVPVKLVLDIVNAPADIVLFEAHRSRLAEGADA